MNLIRFIVIALIIYLVIQVIKRWSANKQAQHHKKAELENKMVKCETCQLHIPEQEAIKDGNRYYCSQAHMDENQD